MRQGFTLIQVSILLVVASLVLVTVLPSLQSNLANDSRTVVKLRSVLTALRAFQAANGRLPCPADASQPTGSASYGAEAANHGTSGNCTGGSPAANFVDSTHDVAIGMVPVQAIALPRDAALDAYGRDITYAVDTSATSCWASASLPGNITVTDNGAPVSTVAALVSHGADGHGAWLPLGGSSGTAGRLNAGSTDADQLTNAHVDSSFNPLTTLTSFVNKPATSTFDDKLVYQNLTLWNINTLPSAITSASVTVTPPANGTYLSGQTLTFVITFPQSVTVSGAPRLDLSALSNGSIGTGNKAYAAYASGSGTTALTFTYTVQSGDAAPYGLSLASPVDMNGGSVTPCFTFFTAPSLSGVIIPASCNYYAYNRAITISHTQVPNTDQTNFPLLFSGTYAYLANGSGNGTTASTSNSNGYDIIFASSQTSGPLSFEQESYSATTGQVNYWVRIPTLSHTADTVIYLCYGNASDSAFQSIASTVWDSYYQGVWHLPNGTTLSAGDSTSNGNNGTVSGATATTGAMGGGAAFSGSAQYITILPSVNQGNTLSVSAWFNTTSDGVIIGNANAVPPSGTPSSYNPVLYVGTDYKLHGGFYNGGSLPVSVLSSSATVNDGNWHLAAWTQDGTTQKLYVDGGLQASNTFGGNVAATYFIGAGYTNFWSNANSSWFYFTGSVDEAEVSTTARSADWISTEYNNQSSPGTFYSIGAATAR